MKKFVFVAFSILAFPATGFSQLTGHEHQMISELSARLKKDVEWDDLGGSISAAVVKDNKVIWAEAYGKADKDRNIPADTNTLYRIGSITKTFTATLMMLLVEDKKINLDDPAEKYVPEVAEIQGYSAKHKITLKQLASHTSGLKREPENMVMANLGPAEQWGSLLLKCLPHTRFDSKPGSQFLYSDIGFAILGLALERASGEPYLQMIKRRIIEPLHMHDTFFVVPDDKVKNLAVGLWNTSGAVDVSWPYRQQSNMGYNIPDGALYSTPTDLAKFVSSFIVKPQLLTKSSIRKMQDISSESYNYGLGLMISSGMNRNTIEHDGYVAGYTAQFVVNLDSRYSIIIMRNYNQGSTDLNQVAKRFLRDL